MEKHLIRTEVLNLSLDQWEKVKELEKVGFIEVTVVELYDLIGCTGGMFFSGKVNEREALFIEQFHLYAGDHR